MNTSTERRKNEQFELENQTNLDLERQEKSLNCLPANHYSTPTTSQEKSWPNILKPGLRNFWTKFLKRPSLQHLLSQEELNFVLDQNSKFQEVELSCTDYFLTLRSNSQELQIGEKYTYEENLKRLLPFLAYILTNCEIELLRVDAVLGKEHLKKLGRLIGTEHIKTRSFRSTSNPKTVDFFLQKCWEHVENVEVCRAVVKADGNQNQDMFAENILSEDIMGTLVRTTDPTRLPLERLVSQADLERVFNQNSEFQEVELTDAPFFLILRSNSQELRIGERCSTEENLTRLLPIVAYDLTECDVQLLRVDAVLNQIHLDKLGRLIASKRIKTKNLCSTSNRENVHFYLEKCWEKVETVQVQSSGLTDFSMIPRGTRKLKIMDCKEDIRQCLGIAELWSETKAGYQLEMWTDTPSQLFDALVAMFKKEDLSDNENDIRLIDIHCNEERVQCSLRV